MSGKSGNIYNIAGKDELSNLDLVNIILEIMGKDSKSINFVADRKGHDLRYALDDRKIRESLGFSPSVQFEDGLKDTIKWYSDNEHWWKARV